MESKDLNSIIQNFQIIKYEKITDRSKHIHCFKISTQEEYLIKITKSEKKYENRSHCFINPLCEPNRKDIADNKHIKLASTSYDSLDSLKILQYLNHANLLRLKFHKSTESHTLSCFEHFEEANKLAIGEDEFIIIFKQILNLFSYLKAIKIFLPEVNIKDILINDQLIVKMRRLRDVRIVGDFTLEMEVHTIYVLKKLLEGLIENKNVDFGYQSILKLHTLLKTETQLDRIFKLYEIPYSSFDRQFLIIDPLVLSKISDLKLSDSNFNVSNINQTKSKEHSLYRLLASNFISVNLSQNKYFCQSNVDEIAKLSEMMQLSIKERIEILNPLIYTTNGIFGFFKCLGLNNKSIIDLDIMEYNCVYKIIKILYCVKATILKIHDTIVLKNKCATLKIVIKIMNNKKLRFIKEYGHNAEFIYYVSKIVEISKLF